MALNDPEFKEDIKSALNRAGVDNQMGIPDDVLADYLVVHLLTIHSMNVDCIKRLESGGMDKQV